MGRVVRADEQYAPPQGFLKPWQSLWLLLMEDEQVLFPCFWMVSTMLTPVLSWTLILKRVCVLWLPLRSFLHFWHRQPVCIFFKLNFSFWFNVFVPTIQHQSVQNNGRLPLIESHGFCYVQPLCVPFALSPSTCLSLYLSFSISIHIHLFYSGCILYIRKCRTVNSLKISLYMYIVHSKVH